MNNKDLNIVQEAMLGQLMQSFRRSGQVSSFAAVLTSVGKISFLAASARQTNVSDQGTMRMLEAGLNARILQSGCRAIGTCQVCGSTGEEAIRIFLEHADGHAYQVAIPYVNGALRDLKLRIAVMRSVAPRFFLSLTNRSA